MLEPDDAEPDYSDDNALAGIPDLMLEPPTALIKIHAVFTAQHSIQELRFQWEMGNLTRGDCEMLAQLGKEIAAEIEREN